MDEEDVQTRSADGELKYFLTVREAFDYAKAYSKVWKVSWFREISENRRENIRFIRRGPFGTASWEFESADELVERAHVPESDLPPGIP